MNIICLMNQMANNFPDVTIKTFVNRSYFTGNPEVVLLFDYPGIIKVKKVLSFPRGTIGDRQEAKLILNKVIESANHILKEISIEN